MVGRVFQHLDSWREIVQSFDCRRHKKYLDVGDAELGEGMELLGNLSRGSGYWFDVGGT